MSVTRFDSYQLTCTDCGESPEFEDYPVTFASAAEARDPEHTGWTHLGDGTDLCPRCSCGRAGHRWGAWRMTDGRYGPPVRYRVCDSCSTYGSAADPTMGGAS
ncbi:MAG: hypothetical protein LC635_00400 [Pseudonocardiaceae bacterium]|nr:hypothetical protein [Pseudonocardiaceae bacterium]